MIRSAADEFGRAMRAPTCDADAIVSGDIIAATATAWGEAAIGIVRLSGLGSVALVDEFFEGRRRLADEPPRRMTLGRIRDADSVLAVRFEQGASYTGEESVEVHCHGGNAAVSRCMALFTGAGARVALPGEFTKRAYLTGRIDLAQAEAVLGVIRARSDEALRASRRSLQGELSLLLRGLMDDLTRLRAELEVRLDYPEEIEDDAGAFPEQLDALRKKILGLRGRCRVGLALKNGVAVAIVGPPNAGKSSLLNALLGEERSIVTEIPGTTRDTVDALFVHRGLPIRLVDTAGIRSHRDVTDPVEQIGIGRSRRAIAAADLCLVVLDSSADGLDRADFLASLLGDADCAEKNFFLVRNKSDLPHEAPSSFVDERVVRALDVSALRGDGIEALKDAIWDEAVRGVPISEGVAATERMIDALSEAAACVADARAALVHAHDEGAAGSLLGVASAHLAAPLGADATEELLDSIFSNFCVGK